MQGDKDPEDKNAPTELISTHLDIVLQRLLKAQE